MLNPPPVEVVIAALLAVLFPVKSQPFCWWVGGLAGSWIFHIISQGRLTVTLPPTHPTRLVIAVSNPLH
jgi:hypothetical protein